MKEVIAVYANKELKQYLMKSEVRFLIPITKAYTKVTIELVEISDSYYKSIFGK